MLIDWGLFNFDAMFVKERCMDSFKLSLFAGFSRFRALVGTFIGTGCL